MNPVKSQVLVVSRKSTTKTSEMADSEKKSRSSGRSRSSRSRSRSVSSRSSRSSRSRTSTRSRSRSRSRERGRGGRSSGYTERYDGPGDEKLAQYINELMKEKEGLDSKKYPYIHRLIASEIDNITKNATGVVPDEAFIDLYNDTPVSLNVKALPPAKVFPKFNYAGRIIGPRGAYLKALMKETQCKMILLGKGVMKDKEKERELKDCGDPKFFHLHEDMHVSVHVTAPASEAYARIAYALSCLKKQVMNDNRTLESLPWIAHATKMLEMGAPIHVPGGSRHPSPPPKRPETSRPPPTFHSSYHQPYAPQKSYFERSAYKPPYTPREREREESPPSKAMEFAAQTSRSATGPSTRGRSPGPHSHGYEYPHSNGPPGPPPDHSHSYPGGRPSWDTSGWQKVKTSSWGSPDSPRYAPYKK